MRATWMWLILAGVLVSGCAEPVAVHETPVREPQAPLVRTAEPQPAVSEPSVALTLIVRVIDGDTVEIEGGERVRLLGIDTPERGQEGFTEASDFLRDLIEGKRVRLERDPDHDDRDFFGRLLRHVYLPDDRNVQVLIIEAGHSKYVTRWGRSKILEALLAG